MKMRKSRSSPTRAKVKSPPGTTIRRYRSHGVAVEIIEAKKLVELRLDGQPIRVSIIDGKYHSQLANQFTAFGSIEDIVETLLANQGRTWTLHGHVCDARCEDGHHHGGHEEGGDPSHGQPGHHH